MSRIVVTAACAAVASLSCGLAAAQPPASPGAVADAWQLQSRGRVVCTLELYGRAPKGGPYAAEIPSDCRGALPPGVVGWKPTPEGIALVARDGAAVVAFERWSESLFVSTGAGAPDLQLARAPFAPVAKPPRHRR
jgi:hypothetical protein